MFTKKSDGKSEVGTKLQTALGKADEVLGGRSKIEAAIEKSDTEITAAEAKLHKTLERLAVEEADAALSAAAAEPHQTPVQRAVFELRMRLEAQQARRRGLEQRKIENDDRIRAALDTLTIATSSWRDGRVAEFRSEFMKAAETFAAVLRKGAPLGDAMGASWLLDAMRKTAIYDPSDSMSKVIDMEPMRYNEAVGITLPYPAWEDDPAAKALHDSLAPVQQKAEMLHRIWEQIRKRRDEAARGEQRRGFEAEARPQSVSYEIQYAPEYSAPAPIEFIQTGKNQ